jgi:hypothetical protein
MRIIAIAAALLFCSSCTSTNAYAQGAPKGPSASAKAAAAAPAPAPLSPEQTAKIRQLRVDAFAKAAPLLNEVQVKRVEIEAMWQEPKPNRDQILRAEAEIDALHQQIRQVWVDFRIAALAVLSPEQRATGMLSCTGPMWGFADPLIASGPGMGRGWGSGRGMGWGFGSGPCGRHFGWQNGY